MLRGGSQLLCQLKRLTEPDTCLLVVPPCAEHAQIKQALPFQIPVTGLAGQVQRLFIVDSRSFKLAQGVVSLPAHPIQGRRRSHREVMGSPQCCCYVLDSGTGCRQGQRFFTEESPVFEGLYPHPGQ